MIATATSEIACPAWASEPEEAYHLRESVIQALRHSGYSYLSNLKCEVLDGVVDVFGIVPSFFLKQVTQTIILRIGQVKEIRNNLNVISPEVLVGFETDTV